MKQFFITLLAVIVGQLLWGIVSVFFYLIMFFMIISAASSASTSVQVPVKDNSLLVIDLTTEIADRSASDYMASANALMVALNGGSPQLGLYETLEKINDAATDKKINGIYLKGETSASSIPVMTELRKALAQFKEASGKPVFYYSSSTSQSALYVASVADAVYITPQGTADVNGITGSVMFYKDMLDKLDVDIQVFRHGKFKSAVEPYTLNKMSDASREQTQTYIDAMWAEVRDGIAASRGISAKSVDDFANNVNSFNPQAALDARLVDGLIYYDQFLALLRDSLGLKANADIPISDIADYNKGNKLTKLNRGSNNKIAVIYAVGEIQEGSNKMDLANIYADDLARTIREARNDESVKAVVMRVNSPGGSALASDIIWREVAETKRVKPFVVSMGECAASGGYYISCAADVIVAEPATLTGSIGVFGLVPCLKKTIGKIGLNIETVNSNQEGALTAYSPLTAKQSAAVQATIERVYSTFVGRCAEGRNKTDSQIDDIAQGRVWAGTDAKRLGLIDEFGGLTEAIEIAADRADLGTNYSVTHLPSVEDSFMFMLKQLGLSAKALIGNMLLGDSYKAATNIQPYVCDKPRAMVRMEYDININQ